MNKSNILCHRGFWSKKSSQNSLQSFEKAFSLGFGIEIDVRDYNSKLVVSHDPINSTNNVLLFKQVLELYTRTCCKDQIIGINIKSDGISQIVKKCLLTYNVSNYFTFDMSIPENLKYHQLNINFFSRISEYEKNPIFFDSCKGIWLDCFESEWYSESLIQSILKKEKNICFVSSEIHNRNHKKQWKIIKPFIPNNKIFLCTDNAIEAKEYFND